MLLRCHACSAGVGYIPIDVQPHRSERGGGGGGGEGGGEWGEGRGGGGEGGEGRGGGGASPTNGRPCR